MLDQASTLILRIMVRGDDVRKSLTYAKLYDPMVDDFCHALGLSIYMRETGKDSSSSGSPGPNHLIRVDWNGKEQSHDKYDVNGRINAFVEYEKSLSGMMPQLKKSWRELIYLQPMTADGLKERTDLNHVVPDNFKMKS